MPFKLPRLVVVASDLERAGPPVLNGPPAVDRDSFDKAVVLIKAADAEPQERL